MNRVIYRTVGVHSHFLNVSSGEILSFEIDSDDARFLFDNWRDTALGLDEDTAAFFAEQGQPNSRLCRSNLNAPGMEFSFPTIVNIELNRRCSLRCIHCYVGENAISSKELGVFLVVLTGGEPFLNHRTKLLLDVLQEQGFVVEVFSNLQYIPDWFWRIDPTKSRIGRIQTSVYSSEASTHDFVTQTIGSWKRTIRSLERLHELGYYVEVATPLMSVNYPTWRDTRAFFLGMGIKQDFSWPIVNEYYCQATGKSRLNISPAEFADFCLANPDFLVETDLRNPAEPLCEAGRALFSITAEGKVQPCAQFPVPVGDICDSQPVDIYQGSEMDRFRNMRCDDVGSGKRYCFCPGNNHSETENLAEQPNFMVESIAAVLSEQGR